MAAFPFIRMSIRDHAGIGLGWASTKERTRTATSTSRENYRNSENGWIRRR